MDAAGRSEDWLTLYSCFGWMFADHIRLESFGWPLLALPVAVLVLRWGNVILTVVALTMRD